MELKLFLTVALAAVIPATRAGFAQNYWELPDNVLDGIEVGTIISDFSWIRIWENVGRELEGGFPLVKIILDSPEDLEIVEPSDFRLFLVPDESKLIWHLHTSTWFDFEGHVGEGPLFPLLNISTTGPNPESKRALVNLMDENDNPPLFCRHDVSIACRDLDGFTFNISKELTGRVPTSHEILIRDEDTVSEFGGFTISFAEGTPEQITNLFEITPNWGPSGTEVNLVKNAASGEPMDIEFTIEVSAQVGEFKSYGLFSGTIH